LIRHSLLTFGIPLEMTFLCLFDSQIPTKTWNFNLAFQRVLSCSKWTLN
jgi:hypothetical protein